MTTSSDRRRQEDTFQANPTRMQPSAATYSWRPPPALGLLPRVFRRKECMRQSLQRAAACHHRFGQQCKVRRHAGSGNIEREKSPKQWEARAKCAATQGAPPQMGAGKPAPEAATDHRASNVAPSAAAPHYPWAQGHHKPATAVPVALGWAVGPSPNLLRLRLGAQVLAFQGCSPPPRAATGRGSKSSHPACISRQGLRENVATHRKLRPPGQIHQCQQLPSLSLPRNHTSEDLPIWPFNVNVHALRQEQPPKEPKQISSRLALATRLERRGFPTDGP